MASISTLVDRVKIFVLSSGTGPFNLGSAVAAYRGVEALIDGSTYSYAVESGSNYEAGTGVYLQLTGQLTRSPTISSAGGVTVAFPAGVQLVFTALAQDLVATGASLPIVDSLGNATDKAISQRAATAGLASKYDASNPSSFQTVAQVNAAIAAALAPLSAAIAATNAQIDDMLDGAAVWNLPDEADGGAVPTDGSGKMYLSGGVMKIA
jgi:hypothetical protein